MECLWCGNIIQGSGRNDGLCSTECSKQADAEFESYLDVYNNYMAGYDVTFEKMKKKPKRKEDQ